MKKGKGENQMIEICNIAELTAQMNYTCDFCGGEIKKGESYIKICENPEDGHSELSLHPICEEIIEEYCLDKYESEWDTMGVIDWLEKWMCKTCAQRDECEEDLAGSINCYMERKKGEQR